MAGERERERERENPRTGGKGEESQATGMPRQMADQASGSMWNEFLLSVLVTPVLSVIVRAT